jgi:hypothetical protein
MEFLSGPDGPIIPDPDKIPDSEHLERTQAAMDFFKANSGRMKHFKQRVEELGRTGRDTVITLIDVNDPVGEILAEVLMPGHDWQQYRDAGKIPIAQGLAAKSAMPDFLQSFGYETAAEELAMADDLKVIVLSAGAALVIDIDFTE